MSKLFCVMGKSGCGKDSLFKLLMKDKELNLKGIVPYTTRPIREGEAEGVQYHFVDEDGYKAIKETGRIIEERAYHTVHGLWRYFTVDDGQIDTKGTDCYMIIGTLEAYAQMLKYFGRDFMVPVYVQVEDGLRLERALARERGESNPKYAEMCRRFLADCEDFSEEKIKDCFIDRRYDNIDLEECFEKIKADIRGEC